MTIWVKDPADTRWYEFDWSQFLASGETITSCTVTVDANLMKLSQSLTATTVLVEVSGGAANTQSLVICNIHTSAGNVYNAEKYCYIATRQGYP